MTGPEAGRAVDWLEGVRQRYQRKNQVLFSQDSPLFQELRTLMEGQSRQVLVLWALERAEEGVRELEARLPGQALPRQALEAARLWAEGKRKMPLARRAILDCHALAKILEDPADAALCHGVGQACSVVHTAGHALGYPIYALTALVRRQGVDHCRAAVEEQVRHYTGRLAFWQAHWADQPREWAGFLRR